MREYLYQESEGCVDCNNAKTAFLLLNKTGFKNIGVMCLSCEAIWKNRQ